MLVGAPKANTSQPGVWQGGAVYFCPWGASPGRCTPIEFDSKGRPAEFREGPERWRAAGGGVWVGPGARARPLPVVAPCGPRSAFPAQPRRAGMIQRHVALISTESPTTQGGQGRNTDKDRESHTTTQFL